MIVDDPKKVVSLLLPFDTYEQVQKLAKNMAISSADIKSILGQMSVTINNLNLQIHNYYYSGNWFLEKSSLGSKDLEEDF